MMLKEYSIAAIGCRDFYLMLLGYVKKFILITSYCAIGTYCCNKFIDFASTFECQSVQYASNRLHQSRFDNLNNSESGRTYTANQRFQRR